MENIVIKRIAIVDDKDDNLKALEKALKKRFPNVIIHSFNSAQKIIEAVNAKIIDVEIIISDMEMEGKNSGYEVAVTGWSWRIPTVIISQGNGYIGHKLSECVFIGYPKEMVSGKKTEPCVWEKILNIIFENTIKNGIIAALNCQKLLGKVDKPDISFGKICAYVQQL